MSDPDPDYGSAIALIGMSGRFPGARSVRDLWANLLAGTKGLREITEEELRAAGVDDARLADPEYVRVGGPLAGIEEFDAAVFGFGPREAETMQPQHRLFLECSWEALESAGYCPTDAPGHVGVFAGSGFPHYMVHNLRHVVAEPGGEMLVGIGNERDSLANLVSYKLGLRGPAVAVQSFCSTSLVAVHLACQSLLTYESDMALAGGAFVPLPQPAGYQYADGGILSADGTVRSFDAGAGGTVMGAGVGAVALKRMPEALADGDVIHAVILGSSVNNDGRNRAGYTAPGTDGQAEVIGSALGVAGVKPETVGYVECHATGTMLGDSIELAAMKRVFRQTPQTPCVLGTLKPSIGHLDRASGVAGLMRAALVLEHETLPGTPDYRYPNPALAAAADRFTVLSESRPWPAGPHPRRAGVSSFGLGGTNAHAVLEQAPPRPPRGPRPGPYLLTCSAAGPGALADATDRLRAWLSEHPDADLADVSYTLQVSRGGFAHRRAVVVTGHDDAVAALGDPRRWIDGQTRRRDPRVRLTGRELPDGLRDRLAEAGARLAEGTDTDAAETADTVEVVVDPGLPAGELLLSTLARLWQEGTTVDWNVLHGDAPRRVELPTYPFQRRRFWVEPDPAPPAQEAPTGRTADRDRWTHLPTWRERPLPLAGLDEQLRAAGPWLLCTDDPRGDALVERLREAGAEATVVRPGDGFAQDELGDFTVRLDAPEDLDEVFGSLPVLPRSVVHGFSLGGAEITGDPIAGFDAAQERGLYPALALAARLVDDTGDAPPIELVLLTAGAAAVLPADLRHPEHAALAALAPSLSQENARLFCRTVDTDEDSAPEAVLAAAVCPHRGPVAVRSGTVWQRHYEPFPLPSPAAEAPLFRSGETVLITGGLGDVGLVLARHLAERYGCRLVLTGRTPLPPRAEWPRYLAAAPAEDRAARHLRNILDLEDRGAEVLALAADVADREQMRAVVDAAVARFGGIDTVVHGAGVQNEAFFTFAHLMDRAQCEAHLAAKVHGFHVLQDVLGDHARDRRITLSSLAAVLGGMALSAYAAANAALDAYARAARNHRAGQWVTVDWDTWRIDAGRLDGHSPTVTGYAVAPAEGIDVFERALAARDHVGHLVISTGPLDARIAQWVTGDLGGAADDADNAGARHPRPELDTPYIEPREGTEATLAEIWSAVLGIDRIGADDNFFELGGHSLVAIKLTARIRKTLRAAVPATALLECPTVRQLAVLLEEGA